MDQNLPRRFLETETAAATAAAQGNRTITNSSYIKEMNFDANMVVILAALLCALIGALGINSIIRCVLGCGYRFGGGGSSEEAAARRAAKGLKKRDLSLIPVGIYGSDVNIKGTDCAICLGEFEEGQKVRMLPICSHGFHVGCIDAWLLSHSSCPNCRHSLLLRPPPSTAALPPSHVVVVIESGN